MNQKLWLHQLLLWLPNTAVLCLLLGIAYLGHLTHWKFPKFSDITSGKFLSSHSDDDSNDSRDETGASHSSHGPEQIAIGDTQNGNAIGLSIQKVQQRAVSQYVRANAEIVYDPTRIARLSARAPGIVWRVEKRVGEFVGKGAVLAIVDSAKVGEAKAELLASLADLDFRTASLERLDAAGIGISQKLILEAKASVAAARIRSFNAHQALVNLGLTSGEDQLIKQGLSKLGEAEAIRRVQFLGLPPSLVREFEDRSPSANLSPLVSPFDGVVIGREAVVGEYASLESSQFVVADTSKMWIEMSVLKEDIGSIRPGQIAHFTGDGVPGIIDATISWIGTELDQRTRTLVVRAEVDNPILDEGQEGEAPHRLLRAHMFGLAQIQVRHDPSAVMTPKTAVQYEHGKTFVFLPLSDDNYEVRPVRVGADSDGYVEILEGLKPGEKVVVDGSDVVKAERSRQVASQAK